MKNKFLLFSFSLLAFAAVSFAQENKQADAAADQNKKAEASSAQPAANDSAVESKTNATENNAEAANAEENKAESAAVGNADGDKKDSSDSKSEEAKAVKKEHPAGKSYYEPSRNHNPMMSPRDYEKIRMEEQSKRDAEEAARRAAEEAIRIKETGETSPDAPKKVKIDHMAVISKKIYVGGIVGDMALINGEWCSRGGYVKIGKPYANAVKLKTVGGNYIIVEYKGKTLTKKLSGR